MIAMFEDRGGGAGSRPDLQEPDVLECGPGEALGSAAAGRPGDSGDPDDPGRTPESGGSMPDDVRRGRVCRPGQDGDSDAGADGAETDETCERQRANTLHPVPPSIAGLLARTCAEIEKDLLGEEAQAQRSGSWAPAGSSYTASAAAGAAASIPSVRYAYGVETVVEPERGRWAVDVLVIFPDGVIRHRIDTFHTKVRAEISARLIKRAAERELRGPFDV